MTAHANHIAKAQFPLIALGGQLNALDALVDSMLRADYLGVMPPDREAAERVNQLLTLCRQEVQRAVELCQLCEEHYAGQNHATGAGG